MKLVAATTVLNVSSSIAAKFSAPNWHKVYFEANKDIRRLVDEEIDPKNEVFNPHFHEAVSSCFHEAVPEEHIIHVVRTGYKLGDKLLRAASVVVSKGKEAK